MIHTSLSKAAFSEKLQELEKLVELRPLAREAMQQRLQHLSGSTAAQVAELLDGIAKGSYDNPSGWLQALRHLQATDRIAYAQTPVIKDLKSALFRHARLTFTLGRLALSLPFLALFIWTKSPGLGAFLLFWASAFFLMAIFNLVSFSVPGFGERSANHLGGGCAMILSSVFYLTRGSSLALLAFSWMALVYGARRQLHLCTDDNYTCASSWGAGRVDPPCGGKLLFVNRIRDIGPSRRRACA